jgi:integrase/recombinase XerD
MLESFFKYSRVLDRMRCGPLADRLDTIAKELMRDGYARATTRRYLSLLATFSRYAARAGCVQPEAIDRALVTRFLAKIPTSHGTRSQARSALGHAVPHVFRRDSSVNASISHDPDAATLVAFDAYLRDVRGLLPRSSEEVLRVARSMLRWYRARRPGKPLAALNGEDVLAFVAYLSTKCVADTTRSGAVSDVRSWLRYLHGRGVVRQDLARLVPRVPQWRLARVPGHLTWVEVRAVIDAIDPAEPTGKRDRALLLIFATTGLRSQEVRRLELHDIDWRRSELRIRRTKSRRERVVPLLEEAGRALAEYILAGRPPITSSIVFLRHVPPVGPLPLSSTMSAIVRRRLARCGLRPALAGAHLLRHSLATYLVQQQRPVKEVADLLGHRRIDTTALYVKVALPQLARVALPFPGGDA